MIIISLLLKLQSTSKTAKVSGAFIICIGEFYSNVNGVSQLTLCEHAAGNSCSAFSQSSPKSRETSLRCA